MVKETRLYNLLEVSTEANEQEIRKAYKFLALKYHPDKNNTTSSKEKERLTNTFNSINEAYNILSDKNKRYLYDNYGEEVAKNPQDQSTFSVDNQYHYAQQHHSQQQQHHHHHHPDHLHHHLHHQNFSDAMASHFNNSFNQFFNNFPPNNFMNTNNDNILNNIILNSFDTFNNQNVSSFKYYQNSNQNNKMKKGRDILDNISCTLLDYYNGKDIKLSLSRRIKCPKCKARGGLKVYTCNDCCGSGCIINETISGMTYQRTQSTCARCLGTGEFIPNKYICDECGGNKLVDTKVIFDFKAPRGVSDGYKIVLPEAADEGINLIPGDVILTLRDSNLNNNLKFKRFGNNLLTTIKVPLFKVLCGGYIKFKHINNKTIKIYIPRGDIQSGNQLKILKGFGMPINTHTSTISSDHKRYKEGSNVKYRSKSKSKSNYKSRTGLKFDKNPGNENKKTKMMDNRMNNSIGNNDNNNDSNNDNNSDNNSDNNTISNEKNNNKNTENEIQETLSSNSNDICSEDEKNCLKFGDLIIKFDIQFPDLKSFSNKEVAILSKILGPNDNTTANTSLDFSSYSSFNSSNNEINNVSALSSTDENSSSNDDMASFKMTPNVESSSSSMTKHFKATENSTNSDASLNELKKNEKVPMTRPMKSLDSSNSSKVERSSSNGSSTKDEDLELDHDSESEKVVYLQDLSNIDKLEISLVDFPEVFDENAENKYNDNGETNVSAEASAKTAKIMGNSNSGLKPRSKRAKVEAQKPSQTQIN